MAAEVLQLSSLMANMRCAGMVVIGNPRCYIENTQLGRRNMCCKKGLVFSPQRCSCVPPNIGKKA
jgi:hypothetical protein